MFRRREKASAGGAPPPQDLQAHEPEPPEDAAARQHALLLQCWRRSEQRVLRTWHAWQAAAVRDKPERYRAYLTALADEERAAALLAEQPGVLGPGDGLRA